MKRGDLVALASGALVGALVTLVVVLIWMEMSRPASFPTTTVTVLPTRAVIPTPTERPELPATLKLDPDGLGLVKFGADGDATVEQLGALLGPPAEDESWTCPDPPGEVRFVRWADLGAFVIDGVFVGWVDAMFYPPEDGPRLELTTTEDLRIGIELEHFEAHLGDRLAFTETAPGAPEGAREFDIDGPNGIHGFVQDGQGASLVISLSAGTTCFDNAP
jgi:hypothetical protein